MVILFTAFSGCKKESAPPVPKDRTEDAAYVEMLKSARGEQEKIASRLQSLDREMTRMRQRARGVLGKDATEEQVEKELASNPGKYPGWPEFKARHDAAQKDMQAVNAKTRAAIRKRILKDAAAQKAAKKSK